MNATRFTSDFRAPDLRPSRPVLSGGAHPRGGMLSSLVRTLLPFLSPGARPAPRRAEPRLLMAQGGEAGTADGRREPHLFSQRQPSPGTAD